MIGKTLGHYEITDKLGQGGMGSVWLAQDSKLGRQVAIKTLPEEFAQDEERLARFECEAKLLASLNHPNIATIHGLEEHEGTRFLVLELVEGDTLADRLKRGAIPVEESLKLALQIAEALEAAHEKGVIHRDLKPANIKVTPDGKIKVLDFGLAKAFAGDGSDVNLSQSPTLSMAATQKGIILGTAAYMSPEQASGETTDKRSDIWSFGVVLFEMLTGRQTFDGKTVSHVLADVLRAEPAWNSLPPDLHPRLRLLLERCLEKEAKDRLSGISDARVDIQRVLDDPAGELVQPGGKLARLPTQSKLPWVANFVLGALIAGVAVWTLRPAPEPGVVGRFAWDLPETQILENPTRALVALAPDGRQFVYNTTEGLYLRSLDALDAKLIPGADTDVRNPVFSPDGQWLAYYTSGKLKKISTRGGAPVTLCDAAGPVGMSWGVDDVILFAQSDGIMGVSANGGTPELIIEEEEGEFFDGPQLLPGGDSILFSVNSLDFNWDAAQIVVQSSDTRERTVVWSGGSDARYVETGHLVYAVGDDLFAIPFDLDTLEVRGGPVPVVEGLTRATLTASANYGVGESGSLMYLSAPSTGDRSLVWVDRQGREEPLPFDSAPYWWPRVSPDGTHVAVTIIGQEGQDVWIGELARGTLSRLTTTPGVDNVPLWTPDNERVVFATHREQLGRFSFFWGRADGTGPVEKLLTSEAVGHFKPYGWSPDAMNMVFDYGPPPTLDIGLLEMEGEESWRPLLQTEANEAAPALSPDGTWIAYVSDQTGQPEIYVQRFPDLGDRRLISYGGGTAPLWSPDGRELFYRNGDQMMAVRIDREPTFTPGRPVVVFEGQYQAMFGAISRDYDLSPDGQRFLMIRADDENAPAPQINIVLNFFEELKERVPVP